jgi:hypothetical protein
MRQEAPEGEVIGVARVPLVVVQVHIGMVLG